MSEHVVIDYPRAAVVTLRPRVLSKIEAAKYIGCGRSKLESLIRAGAIAARRANGQLLVELASLDAYLDSLPDARQEAQRK